MRHLFSALIFSLSLPAFAEDDATMLLAPTPPAQSKAEAPVTASAAPSRFSLGVGTGLNKFGGNRGKLYDTSVGVLDVRGEWAVSPYLSTRLGLEHSGHSFNAEPNGAVGVKLTSLQIGAQAHFLGTALAGAGWDPYAGFAVGQLWRSQTFFTHNSVEKDNAIVAGVGAGTGYQFPGTHLAAWAEASAGQVFFADRFEQEYLESGLVDTTGMLFTGRVGMKYLF